MLNILIDAPITIKEKNVRLVYIYVCILNLDYTTNSNNYER